MFSSTEVMAQAVWTDVYSPTPILLTMIVFLLFYQQLRRRDFYMVEHLTYDLQFIESPSSYGKTNVRIERGPMLDQACRSEGFMDYAAAKASFDYQEDLHNGDLMSMGTESIHRIYVVSALRKPASALLKDDKFRGPLLHYTPHQIMYARRKEAREDRQLKPRFKRGLSSALSIGR